MIPLLIAAAIGIQIMLSAIEFDRETQYWAIKVQHVSANGMLTAKVYAELLVSQSLP